MTDADARCPPEPILELHLAGELPAGSKHATHLASCARCADRIEEMKRQGDAYATSEPARALKRKLGELERRIASRRRLLAAWSATLPLVAAAVWMLLLRGPAPNDLHAKGGETVSLLVDHAGSVGPWNGTPLAPGDVLQLSWTSSDAKYVAVIGREDGGAPVRWFPENEARAERLEPGTRAFGDGMRFDPPFSGTVYAFVGDRPFATDALEAAIRDGREPEFGGKTVRLHIPRAP
jgi:hypothetical protein